jgi:hypothetical protein
MTKFIKIPCFISEDEDDEDIVMGPFYVWLNPYSIESVVDNLDSGGVSCKVISKSGCSYNILISAEELLSILDEFYKT